jgi:carbamoyl-phosphate synthase small subunit
VTIAPREKERPPGLLALADGTLFRGVAVGARGRARGELVFNTAMTGYQEILSDPSYHQQIVALTAPHIGVCGVNAADQESASFQAAGLVVRDLPRRTSSWRAEEPLSVALERRGVVAVAGIDTRRLTHLLRERGAQLACVAAGEAALDEAACVAFARDFGGLGGAALASAVSRAHRADWSQGAVDWLGDRPPAPIAADPHHVVVYDYGVKESILRLLVDRGCRLTLLPADADASAALALRPHGIVLSNGPGDPKPLRGAQAAIRGLVAAGLPIFGVCLGHQLLCLALGAATYKMKFGHHGANHPVRERATGRVLITSQNHGFAVDPATLPPELEPTHDSLFDGSLQGVRHRHLPISTFQGHPEAGPGPHDAAHLFDRFVEGVAARRAAR